MLVKKGILLGFRMGVVIDMSVGELSFRDKDTYPLKRMGADVRVVPGGSSVRNGCYIGKGVVCMPRCLSRGRVRGRRDDGGFARAGGELRAGWQELPCFGREPDWRVLEPVGAMPVVIEDDVLIGGNCGIYEGTV